MIGDKIRSLRTKRGDNLRQLAEKVGMTHGYLGKVERGEIRAKTELLEDIAQAYDMPISYFFEEPPEELKRYGMEWVSFAEEMTEKNLTPDEIRAAIEIIEKFRKK